MLLLTGIMVIVAFSSTSCVRTGHVGIVTVFGRVTGRTLTEGIHDAVLTTRLLREPRTACATLAPSEM